MGESLLENPFLRRFCPLEVKASLPSDGFYFDFHSLDAIPQANELPPRLSDLNSEFLLGRGGRRRNRLRTRL